MLAIVFSFSYGEFRTLMYDPLMILGFIVSHITLAVILCGFVMPRYYDVFVPPHRRDEGSEKTVAGELKNEIIAPIPRQDARDSSSEEAAKEVKYDQK